MKHIHHLRASWLIAAMAVTVIAGESIAWFVTKQFDLRFPSVAVGAVCVGLVAGIVSVIYDGRD